jgi:hypothetical protein
MVSFTISNPMPLPPNGLVQIGSVKFAGAVILKDEYFPAAKWILQGCAGAQ